MPTFRAYCIDSAGKHYAEFEAADAVEAMEIVRVSSEELCFEVWAGPRFIGRADNSNRKASLSEPRPLRSAAK